MKKILKVAGVFILGYLILFGLDRWYFNAVKEYHTDKAHEIMRMKNESFDYIALGSSRTETVFDVPSIDSATNLMGCNLGLDGSELAESYLILHSFFKNGNKAKIVFIQSDVFQLRPKSSYSYPFHEYRYLPYMNDRVVFSSIVEKRGLAKSLFWRYVPFIKYAEFNTEYPIENIIGCFKQQPTLSSTKGFKALPTKNHSVNFIDERYTDINNLSFIDIEDGAIEDLKRIVTLTKANDAIPVIFQPPVYKNIVSACSNPQIENVANDCSVEFWNYLNTELSQNGSYFVDYTHLNGNGAKLFSLSISDRIQKKIGLHE